MISRYPLAISICIAVCECVLVAASSKHGGFGGDGYGGYGGGNGGSGVGGDQDGFGDFGDDFFDIDDAEYKRMVHGILAALAMVILFPGGAILMRVIPGRLAIWVHAVAQIIAYAVYIAGVALGIVLVREVKLPFQGGTLLTNSAFSYHPIIGLLILAALFFQPILGLIHHARFKRVRRRQVWSYLHLWNGRIMITLGIINGGLGLYLAGASQGIKIAYGVVAAVVWCLWLAWAVFAEVRRGRTRREDGRGVSKRKASVGE